MGDNCKVQNYALVYEPAVLEDGVFVGPAVVLTNDHLPARGQPGRGPQVAPTTGTPVGRDHPRGRLDRRPRGLRGAGDDRALGDWSPPAPS